MKLPKINSSGNQDEKFNPFPDLKPKEKKKVKNQHTLLSLALLIFILSLSTYIVLSRSSDEPISDSSANPSTSQPVFAAPTPTPKPLPIGKQIFNYSHGEDVVGPKPTKVIINPTVPDPGESITITTSITHNSDITSAQVILITDNTSQTLDLKLISGDKQNGTWQAKTKIKDTFDYNYHIKFDLRSPTGDYDGGLKLR